MSCKVYTFLKMVFINKHEVIDNSHNFFSSSMHDRLLEFYDNIVLVVDISPSDRGKILLLPSYILRSHFQSAIKTKNCNERQNKVYKLALYEIYIHL